jgi:hypothetical protein
MDTWTDPPVGVTEGQIARELEMVRSAIAMVVAHAAPRVTVAGIRFGEEILPEARPYARAQGVEVRPLWHIDDTGCDIVVEARTAA